jgi:hypothetical protein
MITDPAEHAPPTVPTGHQARQFGWGRPPATKSLMAVGSILDRSISIFVRNAISVLAIIAIPLLAAAVAFLVVHAVLLHRFFGLEVPLVVLLATVPPLATSALLDLVDRQAKGQPGSFFSNIRSGMKSFGAQLATMALVAAFVIALWLATGLIFLRIAPTLAEPSLTHDILMLAVLFIFLTFTLTAWAVASFAISGAQRKRMAWIRTLKGAAAQLFSRRNVATSIILVLALAVIQMFVLLLIDFGLYYVSASLQQHYLVFGIVAGQIIFSAYACLCFVVYYYAVDSKFLVRSNPNPPRG